MFHAGRISTVKQKSADVVAQHQANDNMADEI